MAMTPEQANSTINQDALRSLGRVLLAAGGLGVAARSATGLYGLLSRNAQRAEDKEEDTHSPAITLPLKKTADDPVRPSWWMAGLSAAAPLGLVGGWKLTDKLLQMRRNRQNKTDVSKAREEFENALADERKTKFAADLHELATAYAAGDLDKKATLMDWASTAAGSVKPLYLAAALLSGAAGAAGGYRLAGPSAEARKVDEYQDAMRLRRMARPIGLTAAVEIPPDEQEDANQNRKSTHTVDVPKGNMQAPEKTANWTEQALPLLKKWLPRVGRTAGTVAAGAVATPWLMTHTSLGRNYIANRVKDLTSDPEWMRGQVQSAMGNPAIRDAVMPVIKEQITSEHPVLGRLASFANLLS